MLDLILTIALVAVVALIVFVDKRVKEGLIDTIKKQNEFIDKNIKERVIYTNTEYVNEDKFVEHGDEKKDEDFAEDVILHDLTPEELREQMETKQNKEEGK